MAVWSIGSTLGDVLERSCVVKFARGFVLCVAGFFKTPRQRGGGGVLWGWHSLEG